MSSRVNEVNGENLQDPQSKILATPMSRPTCQRMRYDRACCGLVRRVADARHRAAPHAVRHRCECTSSRSVIKTTICTLQLRSLTSLGLEPRTSALNMTLPAAGGRLAIDICRPRPSCRLQQTSCTSLRLSIDGTDRQTDGRTPCSS